MRNSSRYEGETLRIRCEITAFPLPNYVWLKDGRAVNELAPSEYRRFTAKTTPWGSRCVYCIAILIIHLSTMIDFTQRLSAKYSHCREFFEIIYNVVILCVVFHWLVTSAFYTGVSVSAFMNISRQLYLIR